MEIFWAPSAERDLGRIYEHLRSRSPAAAARTVARVVAAIDRLEFQPELGPIAVDMEPVGRFRHLIVAPLRVIYRIDGERIYVLRIWDARRDPSSLIVPDGLRQTKRQSSQSRPRRKSST